MSPNAAAAQGQDKEDVAVASLWGLGTRSKDLSGDFESLKKEVRRLPPL